MKIKEEQLETIRKQQQDLSNILNQIGYLEAQKHGTLHQFGEKNKEIEEFKRELEEEYGAINISVETGEYTVIEKEEKKEEKADLKVLENVE
ncbi:MAG: hypothetical protein H8E55_61740 [Pelagibacterales bacterium]|nr:hypothetical protein [Pelagibacterales bacterium]|tara:strand:- start:254 stop:529 length:276 start_codon:yes stop_codon:yes gene_type:complete